MLQKTNIIKTLVIAIMFCAAFILPGCEKMQSVDINTNQQVSVITDSQVKKEVDWMLSHSIIDSTIYNEWNQNGITFLSGTKDNSGGLLDDGYPSNSDMVYTRVYVQNAMQEEQGSKSARYRISKLFKGGSFSVRIHANVPNIWRNAIGDAVIAWNKLGRNIYISTYPAKDNTYKQNELDIDYSTFTPLTAVAYTRTPTSSSMNTYMVINSSFTDTYNKVKYDASNTSVAFKKTVIIHELGHAMGLSHTDSNEGSSYDLWYSPCNYSGDPDSIMRDASSNKYSYNTTTNPVFSSCDLYGIKLIWGLS